MKESVTYQAIIEEGKAVGLAEGLAEGAVAEARKFVLLQGNSRFGSPDSHSEAALSRIDDVRRLEDLGVRLLNVESWEELLDQPRGRRGRRNIGPRRV